ncbi:MAG: NAD(P)-binding protein, partial [Spirochaetes bacterium]|nr:NAD(P)-binding protein [Spirochaetota bacterium]
MNTIYHTAVIGGGITGITTSVLLKKESPQLKIILFEKNKFLGGIAGTEEKKGYYFDSVYLFPDISRFLNYLSIEHKTLKIKDSVFKYINAEEKNKWEVDIPYDTDKICKNFSKLFPEDSKAVHSFLAESLKINRQFSHLKTKFDFFDIFKLLFTSGSLMSNMHKTLEEFLNKFGFKNIKLIKVLSALSGLANLPPEELNTLISIVGFSSLQKGAFRQKNSFKEIIDNMIKKLYQSNVEVHKESSVENIKKEKGLFKITLTNNEIFFSKNIISTINTFNIFDKIVSKKNIPIKFLNKIRNLNFSHSAFIIRLIVKNCSQKYQTDTGQMLFYGGENIFSKLYSMANTDQSILDEKNFHFALAVRKQKQKDHYSVELLSIPVSYN